MYEVEAASAYHYHRKSTLDISISINVSTYSSSSAAAKHKCLQPVGLQNRVCLEERCESQARVLNKMHDCIGHAMCSCIHPIVEF